MLETELSDAVGKGDLKAIRSLLDAGANVRYVRPGGYTVMIDVMYGRSIVDDEQLIPVLRLLIERGADLNAVSDCGESALSVASNRGRFDAVGLLLDAGANPAPLAWTPLMRAVALGSPEEVRSRIETGADLTTRDHLDRTAWLLSLQVGDVAKAKMLLNAGAGKDDRGRYGRTPLMHAIANSRSAMLKWLLEQGMAPNETDVFGRTALIEAAGYGAVDSVRLLLNAGADPHYSHHYPSAIQAAGSLEVVRILVDAGADLNDVDGEMRAALTRLPHDGRIDCTLKEYQAAKNRVFGSANPQRMNNPFWKAMVRSGANADGARAHFEKQQPGVTFTTEISVSFPIFGTVILWKRQRTQGFLGIWRRLWAHCVRRSSRPSPRADAGDQSQSQASAWFRKVFPIKESGGVGPGLGGGAVWCFDRYGKSINVLPDGRIIEIAGEHEDSYDEEFCIYNDVIVHRVDGTFDIYGYPETVFPPTDFHTATLVGDSIYIIGGLGYKGKRRFGVTPVYRLDVDTLAIEAVESHGESPGWLHGHKAKLVNNRIEIKGGAICNFADGEERCDDNPNTYVLDLETRAWSNVP